MTDSWVRTDDGALVFVSVHPHAESWMIVVDAWPQVPMFATEAEARCATRKPCGTRLESWKCGSVGNAARAFARSV